MGKWPVFICYRQSDGKNVARRTRDLLHGQTVTSVDPESGATVTNELDVYFDQAAPAAGDWTEIHEPYLKRARAFIVVCTPGAKLKESIGDWVHQEINWWLENNSSAPVLIDALGEEARYVPDPIASKWPNAQRIRLVEAEWGRLDPDELRIEQARVQERLIGGITSTAEHYLRRELEEKERQARTLQAALDHQKKLSVSFQVAFVIAALFLFLAMGATWYAFQQQERTQEALISEHEAKVIAESAKKKAEASLSIAEEQRKLADDRATQIKHDRDKIQLERRLGFRMSYYSIAFDRLLDSCRGNDSASKMMADQLRRKFEYQPIRTSCEVFQNLKESSQIWSGRPRRLIANISHKEVCRLFGSIKEIERKDFVGYIMHLRNLGQMVDLDWQRSDDTIEIIYRLEELDGLSLNRECIYR